MRVCFITHSVHPTAGGSTKYFYEVAQAMKQQGHHIAVVCTSRASSQHIDVDEIMSVKQIYVPVIGQTLHVLLFGLLAFIKVIGKRFDFYIYESGYIGIWAVLFRMANKKPLVAVSLRYGLNVLKLNLRNMREMLKIGLWYIPWELTFFANEVLDVHLSNHVIVLSNEGKQLWHNHGLSPDKVQIVPYGVDLAKYHPTDKDPRIMADLALGPTDIVTLFVGHLDSARNPDIVIHAFSTLLRRWTNKEHIRLLIIGSGILDRRLKALANEFRITEHIRFIPHINDEENLNKIYNLGTLMIVPQVPGTVAILAVACGIPVVALQNTSGFLGAIDEQLLQNFVLFQSLDPTKIASICHRLLDSPEEALAISNRGLDLIKQYDWGEVSRKLTATLLRQKLVIPESTDCQGTTENIKGGQSRNGNQMCDL